MPTYRRVSGGWQSEGMAAFFLSIFRFVRLLMGGHQAVAIERAALRLQGRQEAGQEARNARCAVKARKDHTSPIFRTC